LPDLTRTDIAATRPVILTLHLFTSFKMLASHQKRDKDETDLRKANVRSFLDKADPRKMRAFTFRMLERRTAC